MTYTIIGSCVGTLTAFAIIFVLIGLYRLVVDYMEGQASKRTKYTKDLWQRRM